MESNYNEPNLNPDLEKIRQFRGTFLNFNDYWKSRGINTDPYKGTLILYPNPSGTDKGSLPYQTFNIYKKSN